MKNALWLLLAAGACFAQTDAPQLSPEPCQLVATFPADGGTSADRMSERERYELLECVDGTVTIRAYQKGRTSPALIVPTDDEWPRQIVAGRHVLVLVWRADDLNRVFAFDFKDGVPELAVKEVSRAPTEIRASSLQIRVNVPIPVQHPYPPQHYRDHWFLFPVR